MMNSSLRGNGPLDEPAPLDEAALLSLWERAVGQPPWRRDDLLLAASGDPNPPRRLGARNARLMTLHSRLFGTRLDLVSACPQCGAAIAFSGASDTLAAELTALPSPADAHVLEVEGHHLEFRLPDSDAVADAAQAADDRPFELSLLSRCVIASTRDGAPFPADRLPESVRHAVSERMEALDPAATVSFDLECPDCATRWSAPLDVGHVIWSKIQTFAERLLLDVDALARAYGWTERDVLALSPVRRAAYLQLATS